MVRVNGGHNVPFQSLLRDAEPDYQVRSKFSERNPIIARGVATLKMSAKFGGNGVLVSK